MDSPFKGMIRQQQEPYVRFRKLNIVTFLNPKPEQIRVDDIAWHLARTCRYNAALNQWYSNAEHSVLGAWKAGNRNLSRAFLIHDAAEYVFGDIASPVGRVCPDYKAKCHDFQVWLYKFFLGYVPDEREIKVIDDRLCATEMRVIRKQPDEDLCAEPYDDIQFQFWDWKVALQRYMDVFQWLFPEYKGE